MVEAARNLKHGKSAGPDFCSSPHSYLSHVSNVEVRTWAAATPYSKILTHRQLQLLGRIAALPSSDVMRACVFQEGSEARALLSRGVGSFFPSASFLSALPENYRFPPKVVCFVKVRLRSQGSEDLGSQAFAATRLPGFCEHTEQGRPAAEGAARSWRCRPTPPMQITCLRPRLCLSKALMASSPAYRSRVLFGSTASQFDHSCEFITEPAAVFRPGLGAASLAW